MKVIKFLWRGFLYGSSPHSAGKCMAKLYAVYIAQAWQSLRKNRYLNCQLISNSVIQIHSFCLVRYYAGLAQIVSVLIVGEADGQGFSCSIAFFWAHNSEYKHLIRWYWTELEILFCSLTNKNRLMTKKSSKSQSIIFTRNTYTEEQNLSSKNITGKNVVL